MSAAIRESARDSIRNPLRPAPKLPAGLRPDGRTAATWSLSFARIRNAAAIEHIGRAVAELEDDGDLQTLALLEQLQERLAARGRTLTQHYRRAASRAPEAA